MSEQREAVGKNSVCFAELSQEGYRDSKHDCYAWRLAMSVTPDDFLVTDNGGTCQLSGRKKKWLVGLRSSDV